MERPHPMMVPRLKVTDLFSKALLLPMFVYGDRMAVFDFIHLSATGVAEIAESTNLKACPDTFVYTVSVYQAVLSFIY